MPSEVLVEAGQPGKRSIQLIQQVIDKFYYHMIQPIFTREAYSLDQYLNPSNTKIKRAFTKKSTAHRLINAHNEHFSLDEDTLQKTTQTSDNHCLHELKDILTDNSLILKEIKQVLTHENTTSAPHTAQTQEIRLLKQKNATLEADLRVKDLKLETLREKYEDLLSKFEHFSSATKNNSFNSSFDSNTNRSFSMSRKSDYIKQLKRIRERLKQVNFSKIFMMINQLRTPKDTSTG